MHMVDLFLDVQKKGLRLEMYYEDELVGKVTIESNGDMIQALRSTSVVLDCIVNTINMPELCMHRGNSLVHCNVLCTIKALVL